MNTAHPDQSAATPPLKITYVGHATILIEIDGVRILTDPILRNRIGHLRRMEGQEIDEAHYQDLDMVLISHLHGDHFDWPSLRKLGGDPLFVVPTGAGQLFRRIGFPRHEELAVGDRFTFGSLEFLAAYAEHSRVRHPYGAIANSISFVISGAGGSIYFAGDTDLYPGMATLADHLDIALLPIWGWGPTLGPGHMNPLRAAHALTLLRPDLVVPIHWGTLYPMGMTYITTEFLTNPPIAFARYANHLAPEVQVEIVQPGQQVPLNDLAEDSAG